MREKTTTKQPKSSDIALKVEHVSKSFHLPTEQSSSIKQVFINRMRGVKGYTKQEVLKDISFEVKKGDFFGIVGRNGSGKSTLLKLISQIYTPDSGKITVNGSLVPFIELGVGFNPELTGRENVYLNGAMLGFSRDEIDDMYDDIVEFAEIADFMDQKLKNYSSGMQVRLAFSVAIKAQGDILVLDEVLAVGDEAFQRKCSQFFEDVKKDTNKTVILVTHDMSSVTRFCNKAMLIDSGEIKSIGDPEKVSKQYSIDNIDNKSHSTSAEEKANDNLQFPIKKLDIELTCPELLQVGDKLTFRVTYMLDSYFPVDLGISIIRNGASLVEHNTKMEKIGYEPKIDHSIDYEYDISQLNPGAYAVTAAIFERESFTLKGFNVDSCRFIIDDNGKKAGGILREKGRWLSGEK